jgi:hypothetical protein
MFYSGTITIYAYQTTDLLKMWNAYIGSLIRLPVAQQ